MKNKKINFNKKARYNYRKNNTSEFNNCIKKSNKPLCLEESEACKIHRKELEDMKIKLVNVYKDKTITTFRHPKLKELSFTKKDPVVKEHPTEEITKEIRLDKIPFAEIHNKLVNNLYTVPNRLKQAALEASHNAIIIKTINKMSEIKDTIKHRYLKQKSNYYIQIYKYNQAHTNSYPFITKYINKPFKLANYTLETLHTKLMHNLKNYHYIALYDKKTDNQLMCYVNNIFKINFKYNNNLNSKAIYKSGSYNKKAINRLANYLINKDNNFEGITVTYLKGDFILYSSITRNSKGNGDTLEQHLKAA